jgi:streptomycin 6-kinase
VTECRARWGLVPDGSFPQSYRYVEPVRRADGTPAVLRLGPVGDLEFELELDAAEWFGGHGCVRVLEIDRRLGAVLVERALPGTRLRDLWPDDDESATVVAADVMRALWRPPVAGLAFPTVQHWGRLLDPASRAAGLFFELCASMEPVVVLHGDLHHDNVLRAGYDNWSAIDPKGVVGEPAYETGALMRNPIPGLLDVPDPARVLRWRADQLAELLAVDVARVRGWAYAQAVLAGVWAVSDGQDPSYWHEVAALLEPLTRAP